MSFGIEDYKKKLSLAIIFNFQDSTSLLFRVASMVAGGNVKMVFAADYGR